MKKGLFLAMGFVLAASTAFAADAASTASTSSTSASSNGSWVIQLQGGMGLPISSQAASIFSAGFNAEAQVGYAFSKDFSLSVESGIDSFPLSSTFITDMAESHGATGVSATTSASLTHVPLELVGQFNFQTGGSVTPYLLLGAGVAFDSFGGSYTVTYNGGSGSGTIPSTSNTNFELDPGIGVAFNVATNFNIFVQGKLDMDFAPTSGTNAETNDNPVMLIPIQVGANISLN